jgi:nucleotide-binding universal stress UspA family protein
VFGLLGPNTVPAGTSKSIPSSANTRPKRFASPVTSTAAFAMEISSLTSAPQSRLSALESQLPSGVESNLEVPNRQRNCHVGADGGCWFAPRSVGRNVVPLRGGYSATMFEFGTDGPSLILAAVDGSETSMRAGAYAAGLARRQNSRFVVVYVHHTSGAIAAAVPGAAAVAIETNASIVDEIRQEILVHGPRLGIEISFVERHGSPFHEIARLAEELHADALVVGASMQAGHRIVGSLATHLVRWARCPVTVVP